MILFIFLVIAIIIIIAMSWADIFRSPCPGPNNPCRPTKTYAASIGYTYYNGETKTCDLAKDNLAVGWSVNNQSNQYVIMQLQVGEPNGPCQALSMVLPGINPGQTANMVDYTIQNTYPSLYQNCVVYFANAQNIGSFEYSNGLTISGANPGQTVVFTIVDDSSSDNGISVTYTVQ